MIVNPIKHVERFAGIGADGITVHAEACDMHSSYVVTDPKGTVLVECGKMLEKGGYVIKSLNTINFRKSMHYNPFSYIRSEKAKKSAL